MSNDFVYESSSYKNGLVVMTNKRKGYKVSFRGFHPDNFDTRYGYVDTSMMYTYGYYEFLDDAYAVYIDLICQLHNKVV